MMPIQIQILFGVVWKMGCAPHAFILIPEQKIWTDARSYCRDKHLDLATVQSHDDRTMIQEAADDGILDSLAWIGLYDGLSTWRWSYEKKAISFTKWQLWRPNRSLTQDACVYITRFGEWIDTSCAEERFFVCYQREDIWKNVRFHPPFAAIVGIINTMEVNGRRDLTIFPMSSCVFSTGNSFIPYHFIKTSETWLNALQHCRRHFTDLVFITNEFENTYVAASTELKGNAWIGLSRNTWLWSDGTHVSHMSMKWIHLQPDNLYGSESCGYVHANGSIGDDLCSAPRQFFCTQIRKRQTLMVSVDADDNQTEFTAMAAVVEKINQVLSANGMDVGSNVTLRTYSKQTDVTV